MTYGDSGILHDLKPPMKATVVRWIFQVAQFFPTWIQELRKVLDQERHERLQEQTVK